jgi:hypothetical protein
MLTIRSIHQCALVTGLGVWDHGWVRSLPFSLSYVPIVHQSVIEVQSDLRLSRAADQRYRECTDFAESSFLEDDYGRQLATSILKWRSGRS